MFVDGGSLVSSGGVRRGDCFFGLGWGAWSLARTVMPERALMMGADKTISSGSFQCRAEEDVAASCAVHCEVSCPARRGRLGGF